MSVREKILRQIQEIEKTLYGLTDVIRIFCLSKATDLTIMLLGAHATAKSSLARVWSKTVGLDYRIVTSSEVDESLIAYIDPAVFREKNIVQMRRGELMERDHIIVDEFFLWLNKYRAKLHQLLEERTYAGLEVLTKTYTFLSNPLTEYYAGQIEEKNLATIDRIDLFVLVRQPKMIPSEHMIRKFSLYGRKEKPVKQVITWEDYLKAREEIKQIEVPSRIVVWLTLFAESLSSCKHVKDKFSINPAKLKRLCAGCNEKEHLCSKVAMSKPRFLRATILLAKGLAWLKGKKTVSFEEINEAIPYTLPHRLVWLDEEKTFEESLEAVPDLVQQFNDDMLAWRNRGIFSKLARIVAASKEEEPYFERDLASSLLADVQEIHVLKGFITETLEEVRKKIFSYYLERAKEEKWKHLKEIKNFVERSNLLPYEREDLVFEIALNVSSLSHKMENNPENIEKIIQAIETLHKKKKIPIDTEEVLRRRFKERVGFETDLIKIREKINEIRIVFSEPTIRRSFLKLLGEKK